MRERILQTLTIVVGVLIAMMFVTDGAVVGIVAQDTTHQPTFTATPQAVIEATAQAAGESVAVIASEPLANSEIIIYVLVAALIAAAAMLGVSTPPWTVALLHKSVPSDERVQATADDHKARVLSDDNPGNDWQAQAAQIAAEIVKAMTPEKTSGVPPITDTSTVGAVKKSDVERANDAQ